MDKEMFVKHHPQYILDGDKIYRMCELIELNPILYELTNREARVFIKTRWGGTITGVFTIQARNNMLHLMTYPGLNYHPMCADIRLKVHDILSFDKFELKILEENKNGKK